MLLRTFYCRRQNEDGSSSDSSPESRYFEEVGSESDGKDENNNNIDNKDNNNNVNEKLNDNFKVIK